MKLQIPVNVATDIERQFNTLAPDGERSRAANNLRKGDGTLADLRTVHAHLNMIIERGTAHQRANAIKIQDALWAQIYDAEKQ